MYSAFRYSEMALDATRMDAYESALARVITPDSIVLDLGAGTGIFALLAARAGAKRVHACEMAPAIHLLPELARANGVADRIIVHHGLARDLELPEKADLIISDLRGSMPMLEGHLATLRDAKARLLAPDGILLPERDDLFVAAFESDAFAQVLGKSIKPFVARGFAADALWTSVANTPTRDTVDLRQSDLVTCAARWGHVLYGGRDVALEGEVVLAVQRPGTVHGLALWFEATIADGIRYTTAPGTTGTYARLLLPCIAPLTVARTDRLRVLVRADEDGENYAWEIVQEDSSGAQKVSLRQTSFFGQPTSMAELMKRSSAYKPRLSKSGELTQRVLAHVDGTRSVRELTTLDPSAEREIRRLLTRYTS